MSASPPPAGGSHSTSPLPPGVINVLLVEDNRGDAVLVRELLADEALGRGIEFNVEWTETLADARRYLVQHNPDVILLDLSLPDAAGLHALAEVKALQPAVPVLVFTGFADQSTALRAIREGAQDYLVKGEIQAPMIARAILYATERRHYEDERQRLEAQVRQGEKLRSLGILAGGVAHDFNNLLMVITGNVELLKSRTPESDASARRALDLIGTSSQQAAALSNQLLAYAGKGQLDQRRVDIAALVKEIRALLGSAISKKVELRCEDYPGELFVHADRSQLSQVLLNLVINASEAFEDKAGSITLSLGEKNVDAALIAASLAGEQAQPGRFAYIRVEDTGPGIPPDVQQRLFEPFFTTKFMGRGLGLSLVWGIARAHHGIVQLQSKVGEGTVFTVLFPVAEAAALEEQTTTGAAPAKYKGDGTLLIIDDEPLVLRTLHALLEGLGHDVIEAAAGIPGIELFARERSRVRAIVLDMTMPDLNGKEVFERIRRISPTVPIIFSTGYTSTTLGPRETPPHTAFLQKPYTFDRLVSCLRTVLPRGRLSA